MLGAETAMAPIIATGMTPTMLGTDLAVAPIIAEGMAPAMLGAEGGATGLATAGSALSTAAFAAAPAAIVAALYLANQAKKRQEQIKSQIREGREIRQDAATGFRQMQSGQDVLDQEVNGSLTLEDANRMASQVYGGGTSVSR